MRYVDMVTGACTVFTKSLEFSIRSEAVDGTENASFPWRYSLLDHGLVERKRKAVRTFQKKLAFR